MRLGGIPYNSGAPFRPGRIPIRYEPVGPKLGVVNYVGRKWGTGIQKGDFSKLSLVPNRAVSPRNFTYLLECDLPHSNKITRISVSGETRYYAFAGMLYGVKMPWRYVNERNGNREFPLYDSTRPS